MAISKAQQRATAKYVKENYDRIEVKPAKGSKDRWKLAAEAEGKSLQQFIIDTVEAVLAEQNGGNE